MAKTTKQTVLRVYSKSPKGEFRRCGRKFGSDPIDLPLSGPNAVSRADQKTLKSEPMLVAVETEIEVTEDETKPTA